MLVALDGRVLDQVGLSGRRVLHVVPALMFAPWSAVTI